MGCVYLGCENGGYILGGQKWPQNDPLKMGGVNPVPFEVFIKGTRSGVSRDTRNGHFWGFCILGVFWGYIYGGYIWGIYENDDEYMIYI